MTFIVLMLAIVLISFCLTAAVLTSVCRVWLEKINAATEEELQIKKENIALEKEIVKIRDEINFERMLKNEKK